MKNLQVQTFFISDVKLFSYDFYKDNRGIYNKLYYDIFYNQYGINPPSEISIIEANRQSLRGLHLHLNNPQAKLLHVIKGIIFDVIVDLRKNSPTFGKKIEIKLSAQKTQSFFIPSGFAHGFCALEDSIIVYSSSTPYDHTTSSGIHFADPYLNIQWPQYNLSFISPKDLELPEFISFIKLL